MRRWIESNGAYYDSYDSNYMIFVNRNGDFNFFKNTDLEHIILIKDEKRIKSFVQFCERTNKTIIYVKKEFQRDILDGIASKDYVVINYYTKRIEENYEKLIKPVILMRIKEIERLQNNNKKRQIEKLKNDEDEEVNMDGVESI